jgi:hypothetical protein
MITLYRVVIVVVMIIMAVANREPAAVELQYVQLLAITL